MSLATPTMPNLLWLMNVIADRPVDGRQFRLLNVLDAYNWEGWGPELDLFLPAERVICSLDRIIEWRIKR